MRPASPHLQYCDTRQVTALSSLRLCLPCELSHARTANAITRCSWLLGARLLCMPSLPAAHVAQDADVTGQAPLYAWYRILLGPNLSLVHPWMVLLSQIAHGTAAPSSCQTP